MCRGIVVVWRTLRKEQEQSQESTPELVLLPVGALLAGPCTLAARVCSNKFGEHRDTMCTVLWDLVVNTSPAVRSTAAVLFGVLVRSPFAMDALLHSQWMHCIHLRGLLDMHAGGLACAAQRCGSSCFLVQAEMSEPKKVNQQILPALVTLGADPQADVKLATIEAFGKILRQFKDEAVRPTPQDPPLCGVAIGRAGPVVPGVCRAAALAMPSSTALCAVPCPVLWCRWWAR